MTQKRPYHHLFGLSWIDFFRGTGVEVDEEVDLSHKQQFLDLVFRRTGPGSLPRPLPDGFEDLGPHNLVTFKSYQEAFDAWALLELVALARPKGGVSEHCNWMNKSNQAVSRTRTISTTSLVC